ncbi:ATP-binding protein [Nocardia amikacinitolerans]|uniref:ATP-binding protein n=1 Tax=Nocardia amikacinitolerans TaxID=756689 RepID=UPI0020A36A99|nr:AAA family ATPase [Nocardia amikacinitolerans]
MGDLVGRARESELLATLLDQAVSGRGRVVLIAGEPGIGKTRLAQEIAMRAEAAGVRVSWVGRAMTRVVRRTGSSVRPPARSVPRCRPR